MAQMRNKIGSNFVIHYRKFQLTLMFSSKSHKIGSLSKQKNIEFKNFKKVKITTPDVINAKIQKKLIACFPKILLFGTSAFLGIKPQE